MNKATECYLALGIDKRPQIVRVAACIVARYVLEMHRYGEFEIACRQINKIAKRFRLGDFACALFANYPIRRIRD